MRGLTRHFLLMTATPHNGKEEDLQLFMALLDPDRFEGRFRDGVHKVDVSDLMRRLTKEELLKFDGTPLFPECRAYTVTYRLTPDEARLYREVTGYVRNEFNRAEALENEGRKGTVGFALMVLQRRLASSPEAIYQSLRRRRERLETRREELREAKRWALAHGELILHLDFDSDEDWDNYQDAPSEEVEEFEEQVVDQATAARTIEELEAEIEILRRLEELALEVRRSETDRTWDELSNLLQSNEAMFDADGGRRKLVIFTEHRDTLDYLTRRIRTLLGRAEAVVNIHGAMSRNERWRAQAAFTGDPNVQILVATDAAGEGINLQYAHLMVNYDLPWNPNRIEQRFGRIHRIGQTEVCHLWNLVADQTREGYVYLTLLRKLEVESRTLGGRVFDVLRWSRAEAPTARSCSVRRQARRPGTPDPEGRRRTGQGAAQEPSGGRSAGQDHMDISEVYRVREEMERAGAPRLQPHFISAFFREAFKRLGGSIGEREPGRFEVTHVPAPIRERARIRQLGEPVLHEYKRISFERDKVRVDGKPDAAFVCLDHPLLEATVDLILERYRHLLGQGTVLVDESDDSHDLRCLFYVEHSIKDGVRDPSGPFRTISKRMDFLEVSADGTITNAGYAPYLDYRSPTRDDEPRLGEIVKDQAWIHQGLEDRVKTFVAEHVIPEHLEETQLRREEYIEKTRAAVQERLIKEINYWDFRAEELKLQEEAGKVNARLNSARARQRADELEERLERRMQALEQARHVTPGAPVITGGALIVPGGLLYEEPGEDVAPTFAEERRRSELIGMQAVMRAERLLGNVPRDVHEQNLGYDVESQVPHTGRLRFIEVKGRRADADTVTITRKEIAVGCNSGEDYILALVAIPEEVRADTLSQNVQALDDVTLSSCELCYVTNPFDHDPGFAVASVNYKLNELHHRGVDPLGIQEESNRGSHTA